MFCTSVQSFEKASRKLLKEKTVTRKLMWPVHHIITHLQCFILPTEPKTHPHALIINILYAYISTGLCLYVQTHLPIMQGAQQCSERVADVWAHHSIDLQSPAVLTVVRVLTVRQVTGQQPKNSSGKRCTDQVSNQCGFHLHMVGQKLLCSSYNSFTVIWKNTEKWKTEKNTCQSTVWTHILFMMIIFHSHQTMKMEANGSMGIM